MRNREEVNGFLRPSDYVDAVSLSGTTAETFTVPANAHYLRLTATVNIYYKHTNSAGTPTAVAPTDLSDGTASAIMTIESGGRKLFVTPGDKISVVAASGGLVTAEYWRD